MKNIAITGVSGYIGTRLMARLAPMESVGRIIGIDIRPPVDAPAKLEFFQKDVSRSLDDIFAHNGVDTAIHLAFIVRPSRNRLRTQEVNVGGSRNFLAACHTAGVRHVIYLSSHTVYGAHPDNALPLKEDSPLRPLYDFQYSWDKVETEKLWRDFADSHREVCVTILRGCPVVGPEAADSVAAMMFQTPVIIGIRGYGPAHAVSP